MEYCPEVTEHRLFVTHADPVKCQRVKQVAILHQPCELPAYGPQRERGGPDDLDLMGHTPGGKQQIRVHETRSTTCARDSRRCCLRPSARAFTQGFFRRSPG